MPVGVEIFNESVILQINSDAKTIGLKAAGQVTTSPSRSATVTRPASASAIFFVEEGKATFHSVRGANNVYTITSVSPGQAVKWYEFDIPAASAGAFGLQLFNAAGELTFDALQRPLVPVYTHPGMAIDNGISVPINTGRLYAVSFGSIHYTSVYQETHPVIGALFKPFTLLPQRSGSSLQFVNWDILGTNLPSPFNTQPTPVLLADVTSISTA